MIERGIGPFGPQILTVLRAPRGGNRTEDLRGGVVDIVAPGVRPDELQAVGGSAD